MSRFAHAWRLPTALALLITLALATGGTLTLPRPPAARAQISATSGQPMASLVDCIRPGRELPGGSFESSPRFATTCFASLWDYQDYNDPRNTGTTPGNAPRTDKAVVAFGDAKVPHPTLPNTSIDDPSEYKGDGVATVGDVGAVYGLAFSSGEHPAASNGGRTRRIYAGAYTKRATRYGPLGPGGIYALNATLPPSIRPYVTIPDVVPGPEGAANDFGGPDATGSRPALFPNGSGAGAAATMGGVHTLYADASAIPMVGRSGLGDIDLDPDERFLYAVNLNNKRIYRFDTWAADPQATIAALPNILTALSPCASRGGVRNYRPFGLLVARDALFLGGICSAETTRSRGDLGARVDRFDFASWQWSNALGLQLTNYDAQRNYATTRDMRWQPWSDDEDGGVALGSGHHIFPQPILADLALDERGNLILGFRDRYGDVTGTDILRSSVPAGDLLLAPRNGAGWSAPATGASAEHFNDYRTWTLDSDKVEVASGALAYVPGTHAGRFGGEIVTTWLDPYQASSYGAAWFDVRTPGGPTARQEIYAGYRLRTFGKAQGLGDIELLCTWSAIGDRVWSDTDGDGLQDSGEAGMDGVRVQLFDAADTGFTTPLATVTTGDLDGDGLGGEWRFYAPPWRSYAVRLPADQFQSGGALAGWHITRPDRGAADALDSDADPLRRSLAVAPQADEEWNTGYDIGLTRVPGTAALGDRVWHDTDGDGLQDNGETGIGGVPVELWACDDLAAAGCARRRVAATTTDAAGSYRFATLAPAFYIAVFPSLPPGYAVAPRDMGGDDTRDSDVYADTWQTAPRPLLWDAIDMASDLGLVPTTGDITAAIDGPGTVLLGQVASYSVRAIGGTAPAQNVTLTVLLPTGVQGVSAPGATRNGSTLTWSLGTLASGATVTRPFDVTYSLLGEQRPVATVRASPPDSNTANNNDDASTLVVSPNIAVSLAAPDSAAPGETFTYRLTASNAGVQRGGTVPAAALVPAERVTLAHTLPPGAEFVGSATAAATLVGNTVDSSGARTLTWDLGTLAPGGSQTIDVTVRVRDRAPLPASLTAAARISSNPTTAADAASDNQAATTTAVRYPDLAVDITVDGGDGPATRGEGSALVYAISYRNQGLEQAENVRISVTLPAEVSPGPASNGGHTTSDGGRTLTWMLGTLAPGASGVLTTIPATVNSGAAAATPLLAAATIDTTTPELIVSNNGDTFRTDIVAPPVPPPVSDSMGMQLAIHSDLDPRSEDGSEANAVYRSTGPAIAWPAGEVLDFTPRARIELPALSPEQAPFYELRARVTGWSLVSFAADGKTYMADGISERDRDALGRSGCRQGSARQEGLDGCGYPYIGGRAADDPTEPTEAQMAAQAHVFWSASRPLSMRPDVYTFTVRGLATVRLTVQLQVAVDVLARDTGAVVHTETQRREQTYSVRLTAPRSAK